LHGNIELNRADNDAAVNVTSHAVMTRATEDHIHTLSHFTRFTVLFCTDMTIQQPHTAVSYT